jgi:hypothetical protein
MIGTGISDPLQTGWVASGSDRCNVLSRQEGRSRCDWSMGSRFGDRSRRFVQGVRGTPPPTWNAAVDVVSVVSKEWSGWLGRFKKLSTTPYKDSRGAQGNDGSPMAHRNHHWSRSWFPPMPPRSDRAPPGSAATVAPPHRSPSGQAGCRDHGADRSSPPRDPP